jgi:WD40 repeat protein
MNVASSMSHDGKRVVLSGNYPYTIPRGGDAANVSRRPLRALIRVVEVDTGRVLFDSTKDQKESLYPVANLSRDGRRLITRTMGEGGPISTLRSRVWDLDAPDRKAVTIEGASVLNFSPDGSRVVGLTAGERQRRLKVWAAATGEELFSGEPVLTPVYSPDGSLLAGVGLFGDNESKLTRTLKVFDTKGGKEVASVAFAGDFARQDERGSYGGRLTGMPAPVFSPDGSLLAVPHGSLFAPGLGGRQQRVEWYFVDPRTGKILRALEDPDGGRSDIALRPLGTRFFSSDGKQFVCVVDNVIRTFDVAAGQPVHTLRGHVNPILAAGPTADGPGVRSVEVDGTLKEWDLGTAGPAPVAGAEVRSLDFAVRPRLRTVSVSARGARVAAVVPGRDGKPDTVVVLDAAAGNGATTLEARPRVAGPDSLYVSDLSADGKRVALKRTRSGALVLDRPPDFGAFELRKPQPQNPTPPSDLTVWDVASRGELLHVRFDTDDSDAIPVWFRLTPDGTAVAVIWQQRGADGKANWTLTMFDVDTGREGRPVELSSSTSSPRFSPDGKRLATVVRRSADGRVVTSHVVVWDVTRGTQVIDVGTESFATGVAAGIGVLTSSWSPDGTKLAVTSTYGSEIYLLDAATGKLVRALSVSSHGGSLGVSPSLAFSPDGRRIACEVEMRFGKSEVSVLDTDSGKELLALPTPPARFGPFGAPLAFSADGYLLRRFHAETISATGTGPPGAGPAISSVSVTTWDATPRDESGR